ncbi:MAG: CotH kinase family protein [Myxococcota bacterium]|nr:CotH kinase family protein [Myxococcota bacterium]
MEEGRPFSIAFIAALGLALLAAGCGDQESGTDVDTDTGTLDPGEGDAAYVFDDTVIRTLQVEIEPSDHDALMAHPETEQYVPATVHYDGHRFLRAAIRYKGGYGSLYSCLEGVWPDLIGRDCDKLNFKIKFSEYDDDRRFYGLKRINLHGMDKDYSRIREILSYRIFRAFDVPASRAAYVRLHINGQFMGLYLALEQVDGQFTRSRFEDGGAGNLYKDAWFDDVYPEIWLNALRTNREENPVVTQMVDMATALSSAPPETFVSTLAAWTDVDQFMRYFAVEQTIAHWDGISAFYCGSFGCHNHNFFIYEFTDQQQVALIAWDLDLVMANFGVPNILTDMNQVPLWNDLDAACDPIEISWGLSMAPACNGIIHGIAAQMFDAYAAATQVFLDTVFDTAAINAWIDQYSALITPVIAEDAHGPTAEEWASEVETLRAQIPLLRERALGAIASN